MSIFFFTTQQCFDYMHEAVICYVSAYIFNESLHGKHLVFATHCFNYAIITIYTFVKQIFLECLLCAKHFSRVGHISVNKIDKILFLHGTYILREKSTD